MAHSPARYTSDTAILHARLSKQRAKHGGYACSLEQAHAVLDKLNMDDGLLAECAQRKVAVTQMVWDIAVASSRQKLMRELTAARRQAKNTTGQARRRAPLSKSLDVVTDGELDALTAQQLEHYLRSRFDPHKVTQDGLSRALAKYSNPPGGERGTPRPIVRGRREDSAENWLVGKLYARLEKFNYEWRVDIISRILVATGILRPKNPEAGANDTVKKKLSRLRGKKLKTSRPSKKFSSLSCISVH